MSLLVSPHWQVRIRLTQAWFRFRLSWKYRPIDQIRASWGREGSKDPWLSTKLFDLTRGAGSDSVDDRTWIDLEFDRLFSSVDSTLTRLGSQCLYHKLRTYRDEPGELEKDYAAYQMLRRETALREKLQLSLWPLRSDSEALTCESLFGNPPADPRFTGLVLLKLIDAFHPLLADPVANSIALRAQSALVVGTNMAGKTTFIKMVGTNIILGRTLGVCFAAAAAVPRSKVMASIRVEHSVESGKSHFLAELERILSFVQAAERDGQAVFLIDELFRGTNTPERVAAGKAVLESLGAHTQVLVTTHDVELQHLLGPSFLTFHFVENPELPEVFDYRVHPGIATSKNAIKLLEKVGFPPAIIREARRLVDAAAAR
jgi:hypothetical protein